MIRKSIFGLLVLFFASLGYLLGDYLLNLKIIENFYNYPEVKIAVVVLTVVLGAVIGALLAPRMIKGAIKATAVIDQQLSRVPTQDLLMGSIGLIIGLIIAYLLGPLLDSLKFVGKILWILSTVLFGYLGMSVAVKKREEITGLISSLPRFGKDKTLKAEVKSGYQKLLDTSVIIDGRIADLCASGFVEGILLVPGFVVDELRHIADSADLLKRNRGRRGLDILNNMRKSPDIRIQVYEHTKGLEDIPEVDMKLVKLAQKLGAKVVTNDYNLNKVAELQGVKVLNINELANAVKPVVLPGEEMVVQVVKDGKEAGQGVAYLDDGTMIVVDGGKRYLGQTISVLVTSVLQTAAGRMIFAKPKGSERRGEHQGQSQYSGVNLIG